MDLDGDGLKDVISGSAPGEIYWFRRLGGSRFAPAEELKGPDGEAIVVGSATAVCAADFNGDGRLDLLLGADDGSVYWYRNVGTPQAPELAAGECLVPKGPGGLADDTYLRPGQWGICSKPCVFDWNADGQLDLLVGDCCGAFAGKPMQSPAEVAEEMRAIQRLPVLRRQWAAAFAAYRERLQGAANGESSPEGQRERAALVAEIQRLKDEIAQAQETISRYAPRRQRHGFVWLFLRKPPPP